MAKLTKLNPLAATIGAAVMVSALSAPVTAAENPFMTMDLKAGYQLAGDMEGKCGEGKCGEGKCGADADKKGEGKCGEGKCGADADKKGDKKSDKKGEGKCGEGKCGGAKG